MTKSLLVLALCAALLACTTAPVPPQAAAPGPMANLEFLDLVIPVPESWEPQTPANGFRVAQYRVPAAAGADAAEALVFYFGPHQGGSAAANTARWASQFRTADGQPVEPTVETLTVDGMRATVVAFSGSYARGAGNAEGVAAKPDQTLLAAVIETPHGNLTLQLHGDRATVAGQRDGFMAMVRGFRQRPGGPGQRV